jgi:RHH-type proline utilization regulon transcriptional repressor/proline dehydrogenase/delta 1-pyrroline-5-carboxylate dehydrogenase
MTVSATREQLRRTIRSDEHSVVTELLQSTPRSQRSRQRVLAESRKLVTAGRFDKKQFDTLDALFSEYGLSNAEGLQLMCLAESLLRVPDARTIDRLIAEKLQAGNWRAHLRGSGSALVNACTRGLVWAKHLTRSNTDATSQAVVQSKSLGFGIADAAMRTATISAMKIMGGSMCSGAPLSRVCSAVRKIPKRVLATRSICWERAHDTMLMQTITPALMPMRSMKLVSAAALKAWRRPTAFQSNYRHYIHISNWPNSVW